MQHRARKRFGQNFLIDQAIIQQIIQSIHPQANQHIVEIGPGQGALTQLLIDGCERLTAIEIDRDLITYLQQRFGHDRYRFQLINTDVLNIDFNEIADANNKITIVGNLPYNISTPLLLKLTEFKPLINDMYFMLQREVVERICAQVGTKNWGRLAAMLQYHFDVEQLFDVPPESFQPSPKVHSSILKMSPKIADVDVIDVKQYAAIVAQSFAQKRKTIRNNLKSLLNDEQLASLSIDPNQRPEQLTVAQLATLSNYLSNQI